MSKCGALDRDEVGRVLGKVDSSGAQGRELDEAEVERR